MWGMDVTAAVEKFTAIAASGEVSTTDLLDEIWAPLPTVAVEEMLGAWRGGELPSGHAMDGALDKARWYGKTFNSVTDVKPLICRDESGELFSNVDLGKGEASLWPVEFRGEVTASMVYDGQPVIDHFKRVDEQTVMGIMNGKSSLVRDHHYYFYLRRD
ncbi:DUF4334 domain-containing protein [Williamsia maris]